MDLWRSGDQFLQHDNAPPHTVLRMRQMFYLSGTTLILCPCIFSDLASCNLLFFPQMNRAMKEKRFTDVEVVKATLQVVLEAITFQCSQDPVSFRLT